jgi:uncharacterized protein
MDAMTQGRTGRSVGTTVARIAAVSTIGAALAAVIAGAWMSVYVARLVITPARKRQHDLRIVRYTPTTITLTATDDSRLPGRYGLFFSSDSGYARLGEILSSDRSTVTRELLFVDRGTLFGATRARWSSWYYLTPRELGVEYQEVTIPTPLGAAPAWLVPAATDTGAWVINVHGRGVTRSESVRSIPAITAAGFTNLVISYRNDGEAPASPDGKYALGATEWHDVDAAIEFAIANGARDVVLMGWSMGGATVLQALLHGAHRDIVRAVILDSPVVDWRSVLDYQAGALRLPVAIRRGVLELIGSRWGVQFTGQAEPIDLDSLDIVRRAGELAVPILLLHSDDDGYVPVDASRALARARPDLVEFVEFDTARHVKLWNYQPERWNAAITRFLARFAAASTTTEQRGSQTRRATSA